MFAECEPNPFFAAVRGDLVRGVHVARDPAGVGRMLANDLQPAVLRLRPELGESLALLEREGALGAAVTGSGPTVFGVFESRAPAEAAADRIPGAIAASPL